MNVCIHFSKTLPHLKHILALPLFGSAGSSSLFIDFEFQRLSNCPFQTCIKIDFCLRILSVGSSNTSFLSFFELEFSWVWVVRLKTRLVFKVWVAQPGTIIWSNMHRFWPIAFSFCNFSNVTHLVLLKTLLFSYFGTPYQNLRTATLQHHSFTFSLRSSSEMKSALKEETRWKGRPYIMFSKSSPFEKKK